MKYSKICNNLSLFELNFVTEKQINFLLNKDNCSIIVMVTGGLLHKSTTQLKNENLKHASVLKQPFKSTASVFLMLYL